MMPLLGNVAEIQKFSYVTPRSIYRETSNEGKKSASTYPCRSLSGSVQENGVEGVVLVVIQITEDPSAERTAPPHSTHIRDRRRLPCLDPARREGEVGEDSVQQQHDGVVVVEERGNPAGLRQAPQETRRERGRAAATGEETHVLAAPKPSSIYRGRRGGCAPSRVPSPGVAAAPRWHLVAARRERGGGAPRVGLRAHLP